LQAAQGPEDATIDENAMAEFADSIEIEDGATLINLEHGLVATIAIGVVEARKILGEILSTHYEIPKTARTIAWASNTRKNSGYQERKGSSH
jgi:hypothetical protein